MSLTKKLPSGSSVASAAVFAAGKLSANIVRTVEAMLVNIPTVSPIDVNTVSNFYITRKTDEGLFREVAQIDISSGKIIASNIERHWMEPYAGVGKWVVDPYHGGKGRLTSKQYHMLIKRLTQHYDVRYVDNVNVANFYGMKK